MASHFLKLQFLATKLGDFFSFRFKRRQIASPQMIDLCKNPAESALLSRLGNKTERLGGLPRVTRSVGHQDSRSHPSRTAVHGRSVRGAGKPIRSLNQQGALLKPENELEAHPLSGSLGNHLFTVYQATEKLLPPSHTGRAPGNCLKMPKLHKALAK